MFLVTTADQRFWKIDEKILFLGEWCKLFSAREVWANLSSEVLPYHWDDRTKLHQDYLYLDNLYEQTLCILSEQLNQIHGVNYTVRYWRIILGAWLVSFVSIVYDRYQSILSAAASGKVTNTFIGNYREGRWIPKDYPEFSDWFTCDPYNQYLYDYIIKATKRIPFDVIDLGKKREASGKQGKKRSRFVKKVIKNFLGLCERSLVYRFNRFAIISSSLSMKDLIKLQVSLGQFPCVCSPEVSYLKNPINFHLRKQLAYNYSGNEFEVLLSKLVPKQIPSLYVENYSEMKERCLKYYPRHPEVILTSTAYYADESFKFWAAEQVDRGAKLAGVQHGGLYGAGLWSAIEEHEIRMTDRFYTWGWKSEHHDNVQPVAAAKLNAIIHRRISSKKNGRILQVIGVISRYSYCLYSAFVASSGILSYLDDQYCFARALSKENQKLLLIRMYVHDCGWSQEERFAHELPGIQYCCAEKQLFDQLNECRLFVGTYNATTLLEAFVANFPAILFWNPKHWELRPSAQPYYEALRRVGILHDTPESAAQKVNEIAYDPISWWMQPDVQTVKDQFCRQFVNTSENWLNEWTIELKSLRHQKKDLSRT